MRNAILAALLILAPLSGGCLEVPLNPCPDGDCFPLDQSALSELLSAPGAFDVLSYAEDFERLMVETLTVYDNQGQRGEMQWSVAKDDDAGLRSIAMRLTIGTTTIDTEVIEGQEVTNVRIGGDWYEGRDAIPQYADPFEEIAKLASEQPDGLWPPFGFDTASIADLDWTITGDPLSLQQVASASNETHTIIIEMIGAPPMITGIETYSGDDEQFTLRVTTGDAVSLALQEGLPRTPTGFSLESPSSQMGDVTVWTGAVQEGLTAEVDPVELEFHGLSGEAENATSVAVMRLDEQYSNTTLEDGTWWEFSWSDYIADGYVSGGDFYQIRTNATGELSVAVYDLWAESWTGGSLQGS